MRFLVSGTTKSVRSMADRYANRLGCLLTPANGNSVESVVGVGLPWAVDNGAFSGFDADKFTTLLDRIAGQPRLLWVACPDVVADWRGTLKLFGQWHPEIYDRGLLVAYVIQDGQPRRQLPLGHGIAAVFIGGTTAFKLSAEAEMLARAAKDAGKLVHMGRVNSRRRLWHAYQIGCDSVDGTSASMFGEKKIPLYMRWMREFERQGSFVTRAEGGDAA